MRWLLAPYRLNRTWVVGGFSVGGLAGLALVPAGLWLYGWAWLVAAAMLLLAACWRRSRAALLLALAAGLMAGAWQGSSTWLQLSGIDGLIGQKVSLGGTIANDPIYGKRGEKQFKVKDITVDGRRLPGQVRASTFDPRSFRRGDQVVLKGKLKAGFGNYQAGLSFARVESYVPGNDLALRLRDTFAAGVRTAVPEPEASLGLGFLLGQRSALPKQLDEDLKRIGLTHIVVASGYNLTILVRAARRLLAGHSKFQAAAGSFLLMAGFVLVTGFSPSMSRAALVSSLAVLAWYYGRRAHPAVLLLFTALVTGLINPLYVWSDLGWYLSFLAFSGVMLLAPMISWRIFGPKTPPLLVQVLIETFSAQLLTWPLLIWVFGSVSVYSLAANLAVVPLVPLAMLATFAAGLAGMVVPALAGYAGLPSNLITGYMVKLADKISSLPGAVIEVASGHTGVMILSYAVIGLLGWLLWRRTRYDFLSSNVTD